MYTVGKRNLQGIEPPWAHFDLLGYLAHSATKVVVVVAAVELWALQQEVARKDRYSFPLLCCRNMHYRAYDKVYLRYN
jgi:hypothetical protein